MDLGKPWTNIMDGLRFHRLATPEELKSPYSDGIIKARQDYYSHALSVVLNCATKNQS